MSDEKPQDEIELFIVDEETGETEPLLTAARPSTEEKGLEPVAPTDEERAPDGAFEEELGRLQQEVDRFKELYLRKMADFENYRKRQEREMVEFRRLANSDLLRDVLPVLDNLERALDAPATEGAGLRVGVELVLRQFKEILGRYGLLEIDPRGEAFDPTFHEALGRHETADVPEHTVVHVLEKGYRLGERLLRPARVVVAMRAEGQAGDTLGSSSGGN
jgi:molecular chaperone GrpE